jgi:DNA ligase-4
MGTGFDKPTNAKYFILRFPRVLKIHNNRFFKETVNFKKLQKTVRQCKKKPEDCETEKIY